MKDAEFTFKRKKNKIKLLNSEGYAFVNVSITLTYEVSLVDTLQGHLLNLQSNTVCDSIVSINSI